MSKPFAAIALTMAFSLACVAGLEALNQGGMSAFGLMWLSAVVPTAAGPMPALYGIPSLAVFALIWALHRLDLID